MCGGEEGRLVGSWVLAAPQLFDRSRSLSPLTVCALSENVTERNAGNIAVCMWRTAQAQEHPGLHHPHGERDLGMITPHVRYCSVESQRTFAGHICAPFRVHCRGMKAMKWVSYL